MANAFDKLREKTLLWVLLSTAMLAIIGAVEYFFYLPYIVWNKSVVIPLYVAIFISLLCFCFFFAMVILPKEKKLKCIVLFSVASALFLFVLFGLIEVIINSVWNNYAAYAASVGLIDFILLIAFGYEIAEAKGRLSLKAFVPIIALNLIIVMVGSVCLSFGIWSYDTTKKPITEFSVKETLPNGNGEKVKVVLLAGQSNASGCSRTEYLIAKSTDEQKQEYNEGYGNVLINFFNENGKNTSNGYFVRTGMNQGCLSGFFGPELGMAKGFSNAYPDETVIILKYAWGGTNLYNQWLSPSAEGQTGDLYRAFINFVSLSMESLLSNNYEAEIVAMCWMQGEADSVEVNSVKYADNLKFFTEDVRRDLAKYIIDTGMLFVDAGITDSPHWLHYQTINEAKRTVEALSPLNFYIDSISEGLEYRTEPIENPDLSHFDALSEIKLGILFANCIINAYRI